MRVAAGGGGGSGRRRRREAEAAVGEDILECGMTVLPFLVGQSNICNLTWTVTGELTALKHKHHSIALASILKSFQTPFNERATAPEKTKHLSGGCD